MQAGWAGAVMPERHRAPMSLRSSGGGSSVCAKAARWPGWPAGLPGYAGQQCFWALWRGFDKTTTVLPYGLLY